MSKTKYKKQNKNKLINTKTKAAVGANLSKKEKEKKTGYIIPTRNCYRKNRQLRDPDFLRRKLYHRNHQQYSQHPILWVVLNINAIVLRPRLIRVQSTHPTKQVGLTTHSTTSLVRNSDDIKYKIQKPCYEDPSLKSTDLFETQRIIES